MQMKTKKDNDNLSEQLVKIFFSLVGSKNPLSKKSTVNLNRYGEIRNIH